MSIYPPCDGAPDLVRSLTDAQNQAQVYDMLGEIVYYLLGDPRRHVSLQAKHGQIKIGISTVAGTPRHYATYNRTIDPHLAKPHRFTPGLCREMGGAALVTILEAIQDSGRTVGQYNSS